MRQRVCRASSRRRRPFPARDPGRHPRLGQRVRTRAGKETDTSLVAAAVCHAARSAERLLVVQQGAALLVGAIAFESATEVGDSGTDAGAIRPPRTLAVRGAACQSRSRAAIVLCDRADALVQGGSAELLVAVPLLLAEARAAIVALQAAGAIGCAVRERLPREEDAETERTSRSGEERGERGTAAAGSGERLGQAIEASRMAVEAGCQSAQSPSSVLMRLCGMILTVLSTVNTAGRAVTCPCRARRP
jgi:hypothetical protein